MYQEPSTDAQTNYELFLKPVKRHKNRAEINTSCSLDGAITK